MPTEVASEHGHESTLAMLAVILLIVVGTIRFVGSNTNNVLSSVVSSVY